MQTLRQTAPQIPADDEELTDLDAVSDPATLCELTLPPCALSEDQALVARTTTQIRTILTKTLTRGMEEVGELLLQEFYGGDPDLARSTSRNKHMSLRLLESRCETMDLPVRRTFLANSLRLALLARELPCGAKFFQLPASHRIELLRLRAPEKVELLASRAVENKLSVQKLREVVRKTCARNARTRHSTPPVLRTVRSCVAALRDDDTGRLAFRKDDVSILEDHEFSELQHLVEALAKRLDELRRLV